MFDDNKIVLTHATRGSIVLPASAWNRPSSASVGYVRIARVDPEALLEQDSGGEVDITKLDTFHVLVPTTEGRPEWDHAILFDQDEWDAIVDFSQDTSQPQMWNTSFYQAPPD